MADIASPARWRFYDFCPEPRKNVILEWSTAQGPVFKTRLNALIRHLETLDRAFTRHDNIGLLRKDGPCKREDLIELILTVGRVEYRPIGWYGPGVREITLLVGATEKGHDFLPRGACTTAVNRKHLVMTSRSYISEHDFR
jgi:hypothetical protein